MRSRYPLPSLVLAVLLSLLFGCDESTSGPAAPSITSISPTSGPPGAIVTIAGTGFAPAASGNAVSFNGVRAEVASASETTLEATVPAQAATGAVEVVVDGRTAVGPNFTVEAALPGVTTVDPDSGVIGTPVTIQGVNFGPTPADNVVTFNGGAIAPVEQASATELTTAVPAGAVTGPIRVEAAGETTLSPSFRVITNGSLEVVTRTAGADLDPDGYTLTLGSGELRALALNDTITLADLDSGSYELEISEIALNCRLDGDTPTRSADVSAGQVTTVTFAVDCHPIGRIAFERWVDGRDIWYMDGDGTTQIEAAGGTGGQARPVWSPDGGRIAYIDRPVGGGQEDIELYYVSLGAMLYNVDIGDYDRSPRWSPDGAWLAFSSDLPGDVDIFVADDRGMGPVNVTSDSATDANPRWSPDAARIAFESDRTGTTEIWVMDRDGANPTQLTSAGGTDPAWSPDGTEILFNRGGEIWKMNADGTGEVNLTDTGEIQLNAAWSPDGGQIAYRGGPLNDRWIYVMGADGSNPTPLAEASYDSDPDWSPDGSRIAYDHAGDIYVIWADGTSRVNLTDTPNVTEAVPRWEP